MTVGRKPRNYQIRSVLRTLHDCAIRPTSTQWLRVFPHWMFEQSCNFNYLYLAIFLQMYKPCDFNHTTRMARHSPPSRAFGVNFMYTAKGCPYCIVAGFNFRTMTRNASQEYVCTHCGHVEYPEHSGLDCTCVRCQRKNNNPDAKLQRCVEKSMDLSTTRKWCAQPFEKRPPLHQGWSIWSALRFQFDVP